MTPRIRASRTWHWVNYTEPTDGKTWWRWLATDGTWGVWTSPSGDRMSANECWKRDCRGAEVNAEVVAR